MSRGSHHLDDRLGLDPKNERSLAFGQSTVGKVLAVTEDSVVTNAGRGAFYVHDASHFNSSPNVGDQARVSMNRSGETVAEIETPSQDRGRGRA